MDSCKEEKMSEEIREYVKGEVHHLYYDNDENCACTMLKCLSHLFSFPVHGDILAAALGMHGAGGYRAQCGLVEGTLMFIGLFGTAKDMDKAEIIKTCHDFAVSFEKKFSSLRCRELRPGGFNEDDPPHLCESITVEAVLFSFGYLKERFR